MQLHIFILINLNIYSNIIIFNLIINLIKMSLIYYYLITLNNIGLLPIYYILKFGHLKKSAHLY